jgi:hypothetical protein
LTLVRAALVILFLSPVGSLGCLGEPMGTGSSFCPASKLMETDLLSCIALLFLYKLKFQQADCSAYYLLHTGFLLFLFFDPEDGGDMFLQNVG